MLTIFVTDKTFYSEQEIFLIWVYETLSETQTQFGSTFPLIYTVYTIHNTEYKMIKLIFLKYVNKNTITKTATTSIVINISEAYHSSSLTLNPYMFCTLIMTD